MWNRRRATRADTLTGWSLRARLFALIGLMALPFAVSLVWDIERQHVEATARARAQATSHAREVASAYRRMFERAQDLASTIAALPAVHAEDWESVNRTLAKILHRYREYPNIRVSSADGTLRASGLPGAPATSNAGREWFQQALRSGDYVVSTPFLGVTTNRVVTVVGYPIKRHRQPPLGIVSVTMEIKRLAALAANIVTPGFVATLIDSQGRTLSRFPERPEPGEGLVIDQAFVERLHSGAHADVLETQALDGAASIVAYERLQLSGAGLPLIVAVSQPRHAAVAPVVERTVAVSVGGSVLLVLVLMAGGAGAKSLIENPVKALAAVQQRIADGDLVARPPTALLGDASEFGELGRTLASLGESLQAKEADRAATEGRLRAIVDAYPGIALLVSADARIEELSAKTLRETGVTRERIIGRRVSDLQWTDQDAGAHAVRLLNRALAGDVAHEEISGMFRPPFRHTLDVWATPIRNAAGQVVQVAVFGTDVTAMKRVEEAARENAARMTLVFNTSSDLQMLMLADDALTIVAVNAAFLRHAGAYAAEPVDPVGMSRHDYLLRCGFSEAQIAVHYRQFRAARDNGTPSTYSESVEHPSLRGCRRLHVTITPHQDLSGKTTHVLWSARDVTELWQAEEKLRQSEERLQEAQRLAAIGSWELDLATRDQYWSRELFQILEATPSEETPRGDLFLSTVYPDDRRTVAAALDQVVSNHRPYRLTHRLLMNDGRIKFVEHRAELTHDHAGKPMFVRGTMQDITPRVETANALRESEERLLQAQRIAQVGDWTLDHGTGSLVWSDEVYRIFGVTRDDCRPSYDTFLQLVHPQDQDRVDRVFRESVTSSRHYHIVHRVLTPQGRVKIVEEHGETDFAADGRPAWSRGTVQDVTERMVAADALRASEASLRQAELLAGLGHYHCDLDGGGLVCSEGLKRLLGYERDAVPVLTDLFARLHPSDAARYANERDASFRTRETFQSTFRVVLPDGTVRVLRAHGDFQQNPVDGATRFFCTVVDVTSAREAELRLLQLNETLEQKVAHRTQELQSINRELESFSYSVSHDLRAPLRAVEGFTHAAIETEQSRLSPDGLALLRRVQAAARRMGTLIDAMLQLAQVSREPLVVAAVDVSAMAQSIVDELLMIHATARPEISIASGMRTIGDPRQIRVALANLLDNAFKFSAKAKRPRIDVGVRVIGGREVYFVRDNGIGFDMALAGKLFQPFERLHSSREFSGTGIGLATVQRVAQRHDGSVWAESTPGGGTTIYLRLGASPIAPATAS